MVCTTWASASRLHQRQTPLVGTAPTTGAEDARNSPRHEASEYSGPEPSSITGPIPPRASDPGEGPAPSPTSPECASPSRTGTHCTASSRPLYAHTVTTHVRAVRNFLTLVKHAASGGADAPGSVVRLASPLGPIPHAARGLAAVLARVGPRGAQLTCGLGLGPSAASTLMALWSCLERSRLPVNSVHVHPSTRRRAGGAPDVRLLYFPAL